MWDDKTPRTYWGDNKPPVFGYCEAKGMTYDLTGEQFAVNMAKEANWGQFLSPTTCGGAKWIFSDSTSGGRLPCEVARVSGEVDGERLPKEAFYATKAMYSETPQAFILGHWNYPAGTTKTVYVMSNADAVELKINGHTVGKIDKLTDHWVFPFKNVSFEPGTIEAIATNKDGQIVAHQRTPQHAPDGTTACSIPSTLWNNSQPDARLHQKTKSPLKKCGSSLSATAFMPTASSSPSAVHR